MIIKDAVFYTKNGKSTYLIAFEYVHGSCVGVREKGNRPWTVPSTNHTYMKIIIKNNSKKNE